MASNSKAFFAANSVRLAPLTLEGKNGYRECQVGAVWATLAHFTSSSEAALISMPTGSGKSALMMMLSFLMRPTRIIIVSPSVVLRGQTANKFRTLSDIKDIGAYPKTGPLPSVHDHTGQITSADDWKKLLEYDVVTVTPHTTSPDYENIVLPPAGLFGKDTLLFVDEAHHSRARTWQSLIESFPESPIVFVTATPFRNDNRRLLAKLVYHYPMSNAMDAGIYSPVSYHAVEPDDAKSKDEELAKRAKKVYKAHKRRHPSARLLIRAEGVSESEDLLELYKDIGLNVAEVNYRKSLAENSQALADIREGKLDGIVCIDQIGEGLDIPNLKIAVLHKPRQSFPATVQFIGRISREETAAVGKPHLIACPDDVRGPLQRLYTHDNSWRDFVPKLVDRIVAKASRRSEFHSVVDVATELDLEIEDIEPFFSVRVYQGGNWDGRFLQSQLDFPTAIVPAYAHEIIDKKMLVIITAIERAVPWANKADLSTPWYDLHVFYFNDKTKLLFECTTSDKIAGIIRAMLWQDSLKRLTPARITKALREAVPSRYLMFGLSNLARDSRSIPSYKTFMGSEVEGAIRPTDARSFTPGHALARYQTGETRGIGSFQGRVWSIKRGSLNEYKKWCDDVSICLAKRGDSRLPNVEFLPAPESISKYPANPLAMYSRWDPGVGLSRKITAIEYELDSVSWNDLKLSKDGRAVEGNVSISAGGYTMETSFVYALTTPSWQFDETDGLQVKVDDGQEFHWMGLVDLFDKFPPVVLLSDGSSVIGGSRYEPASEMTSFPLEQIDSSRDWSGCDIYVEFEYVDPNDASRSRIPQKGKISVHDQLEQWLKQESPKGTFIIRDHGSGEIADYITIEASLNKMTFYHCKACGTGKKPGARIGELNALEQALRSINYIGHQGLVQELHSRVTGKDRAKSKLIKGSVGGLRKTIAAFHANQWVYEVVIVNPGIDCNKTRRSANTNTLLVTCFEWLAAAGARLTVIGS